MKPFVSNSHHILLKLFLNLNARSRNEGGYIIVVVMGMIIAMSSMLLTAELVSRVDNNSTKSSGNSTAGFYAAEAGLNLRAKDLKTTFVGYNVPAGTSPSGNVSCTSSVSGTGDFILKDNLSIQNYLYPNDSTKRIPVLTYVLDVNPKDSNGVAQPTSVTINSGEQFAGLNAQEYRYDVSSLACNPTSNQPSALLQLRFKSRLVPLFQFAAFYDKDLDINPSPLMSLSGPVHTNGDLYVTSANGLTFEGQVTVHGSLYRGRKESLSTCVGGFVNVWNSAGTPVAMPCSSTPITDVSPWTGQVKIGVPTITVPPAESLDPLLPTNVNAATVATSGVYWNKADLRIALKLDSSENFTGIEVRNANGSVDTTRSALLTNSCLTSNASLPNSSTTLAANAAAGSKTLTVPAIAANSSLKQGDMLQFGNNFSNNATIAVTPTTGSTTITLKQGLSNAQTNGTVVRKAIVSATDTFYNFREAKRIRMLNVDVQGVMNCITPQSLQDSNRKLNDSTEGGLVWFLTVDGPNSLINVYSGGTTPTGGNSYGIRLYNAAKLGAFDTLVKTGSSGQIGNLVSGAPAIQGLTVASDQAVYTHGDYNCGWDTTTSACTYKKPAAILTDSINVLSNAWKLDDSGNNSYPTNPSSCSAPTGSNTQVNTAFLSGTDTTGRVEGTAGQTSPYNGGLENYPRFHENWSSKTLFYRGSFVSLSKTRRATGAWGSSCYNPPARDWDYDTDFNNAANLPPLSPRFVYLRQERFTRDFTRTSSLVLPSQIALLFSGNILSVLPKPNGVLFHF
jgi:hypothetical protein